MSYSCEKLFSHPEKLLEDHLFTVGQTARNWINNLRLNFDVDKNILADIACIIGLTHDLGKATKSFQIYLLTEDEEERIKMKNHEETRHSPLSAFCGYYLVQEYLRLNHVETEYQDYLPIAAFLAIQRHHGDLSPIIEETAKYKGSNIARYLSDADAVLFDKLMVRILSAIPCLSQCGGRWLEGKICSYEKDMKAIRSFARTMGRKQKLDYYFITGLFYSTLVDADKCDASGLKIDYSGNVIPANLVDEYRKSKGYDEASTEINRLRNKIYQDTSDVINVIKKGNHILSINVPTGTGKTFNALSVALKIREYLYVKEETDRSIVYALPFTSIIDQNYQVFNDIFTQVTGREPGSDLLLKHHYLADGFYKVYENNDEYLEYSALDSKFITEGWNSYIIVTTFVQLFHSLITNRNTASRKLHRIANSIIILDEVQAIPYKYWCLLRQICNYMAEYLDTYFVLVTATLPLIFPETEIFELATNKEEYYHSLNRITMETYIDKIIDIDEFKKVVINEVLVNKTKDILVVMNTIKSAQIIYEALLKALDADENVFYFLSSYVVPAERKERIEEIKKNQDKRKIVVSTQLIEAGVDIDLDIVFRDIGPLDCVNQVAGRCNRNQSKGRGIVKLYYIKRGDKPDSSHIYDSTLLNATKQTIMACSNQGCIEEKDFYNMSNSYYKLLNQGILSDTESQNVLEAVYFLNYDKIQDFKLIDENYEKVDIFIEINEEARGIWNRFLGLSDIEDKWQRREEFYRFKNSFQKYIISVQNNAEWLNPFKANMVAGLYNISLDVVDTYYKVKGKGDTGFITQGASYAIW